ncbi:hypothetical protein J6590_038146 [Homalodisca vitripennis]|nr:hypothetical protein J6590_038146 [Homalodisca vitripennis]
MTIEIQSTTNGKPHIVFNGHKFRESYCRKNGEKVWRCLGKTCGATVPSNPDMTAVISCKPQHSGHHPVTMRSLASPKAGCTTPSAAAVVETKTSLASTTPPSRTTASPPDIQDTAQNSIIKTPDILTHSTPNIFIKSNRSINIDELELENSSLKNTITDLKKQLRDVTDHAIASDTRLLQYTSEVFELPNGSAGNICPSITTGVVDQQLGARFEDNEADEDSARIHEPSTRVAGSSGTATAAVSAGNETIPAEHSSQSLENLLKLERDKNEELKKQILSLRMSSDQLYLQKELESTAAPAEEGVAFTVVTKKTSKKKKRKPKKHDKKTHNSTKSQTGTEKQIKSGNPETAPTIKLHPGNRLASQNHALLPSEPHPASARPYQASLTKNVLPLERSGARLTEREQGKAKKERGWPAISAKFQTGKAKITRSPVAQGGFLKG